MQKEQLDLNLNPYKFTNQMKQAISSQLNSTNFLIDPTKMIQTKLKVYRFNDQQILQINSSYKLQYQIKQIQNCSKDAFTGEQKTFSAYCLVMQSNNIIENCSVNLQYQTQQTNLNCICSTFGQIFLLYTEIESKNTSNQIIDKLKIEEAIASNYRLIFQSHTAIFVYSYIGFVSLIYLLCSKKNSSNIEHIKTQYDFQNEKIQLYPGNLAVLKQSFKFIHQLSQPFYYNDSIIQKSFYFIDINVQFGIMFLPLCVLNIDIISFQCLIGMLIVAQIGMIYRMISKILQGFYRLNKVFRIIVEIVEALLLIGIGFLIIILQPNISEGKIISKIFNLLLGIIFYEVINEPFLIISSIQGYKMAYQSIQKKEFNVLNHLIYYFAYHQSLEEIFKQYTFI